MGRHKLQNYYLTLGGLWNRSHDKTTLSGRFADHDRTAQISNALRHSGLPILNCHGGEGGIRTQVWLAANTAQHGGEAGNDDKMGQEREHSQNSTKNL